jgi:hypothetical protein
VGKKLSRFGAKVNAVRAWIVPRQSGCKMLHWLDLEPWLDGWLIRFYVP